MSPPKPIRPDFDTIPVSTKTVIARTNAVYDIHRLFMKLPVAQYEVPPKHRGRRKTIDQDDPNAGLPSGSIVTLKYFEHVRGVDLKKKAGSTKYFRNALSVVMKVDEKLVNFKLSKNGKFQMTGIKTDAHTIECVKQMWRHIRDLEDPSVWKVHGERLEAVVKVVMTNIDFALGFKVNRASIDRYVNQNSPHHSLLETSFGYTGVNIKFPCEQKLDRSLDRYYMDLATGEWEAGSVQLCDYLQTISPEDRLKESKLRYNTFLVFHSGNVIMSGVILPLMKDAYREFLDIVAKSRSEIEEKLSAVRPLAEIVVA